jgi:hypothetical protein
MKTVNPQHLSLISRITEKHNLSFEVKDFFEAQILASISKFQTKLQLSVASRSYQILVYKLTGNKIKISEIQHTFAQWSGYNSVRALHVILQNLPLIDEECMKIKWNLKHENRHFFNKNFDE